MVFWDNWTSKSGGGSGGSETLNQVLTNGNTTGAKDIIVSNNQAIKTNTVAGNTFKLQAYDVDGLTYKTFATLTANNDPSLAFADGTSAVTQSALDNSTKLATTEYVDSAIDTENLWDRTGTVLSPHTSGDTINLTSGTFTSNISMGASATIFTNIIAGLNSFVSFKGRLTHSATAEQFKFSPSYAAGTATFNEDLFVYYSDLATTYTGGVDALDGFTYQRKGQKQTTDATQQAITLSNGTTGKTAVLTTVTGKVYQVTADVVGKQSTTHFAGCTIVATFKNVAGTVTQVGTTQIISPNQTAGDWGTAGVFAAFTVSGADIRVSVTGKAATTIDWRMALDYLTL